jgi:hypothetical protein
MKNNQYVQTRAIKSARRIEKMRVKTRDEFARRLQPLLLHSGSDCAVQMVEASLEYARGMGWGKAIKRRR